MVSGSVLSRLVRVGEWRRTDCDVKQQLPWKVIDVCRNVELCSEVEEPTEVSVA
jgi:hypothetical protein